MSIDDIDDDADIGRSRFSINVVPALRWVWHRTERARAAMRRALRKHDDRVGAPASASDANDNDTRER